MSTPVEKFIFNHTRTSHKRWESIVMYSLHYALRDVKLLSQYPVEQYYIDGYFPDLKLAVEIDEPFHERTKEQDALREERIKAELGCEFFRIDVNKPVYEQVDALVDKVKALSPPKWEVKERSEKKNSGEYSKSKFEKLQAANAFEFLDNIQEEIEQMGISVDTENLNPNTLPSNEMISFNVEFGKLQLTVFTRSSCKPKIIVNDFDEETLNLLGITLTGPTGTRPPYWKIVGLEKQLTREQTISYLSNLARKYSTLENT
ncbi:MULTISPECIES: AbaSI family restriction endonuclease [Vibrio]|uniref:DUF559 domain-containing protein n=1 Tax=Vibrio splendidus TaxID=29497 RepID=A0A2T5EEI1_VIBSP|nr:MULTISPECIES: DUF559 domain-containing protein [Vibrio]OEE55658.1 hypothetical protein A147_23870 [Vibrio splendidus FF-6]PTP17748.1 DUF559 domain-containing protein [Vibrio splendidus]TCT35163.1 uncharacterized protein DUF559 [Vibrio crassostreae]